MLSSYKILFFIICLFSCQVAFADVIPGGKPTSSFSPVVQFSTFFKKTQTNKADEFAGGCTGTFIKAEVILTAAHCLINYGKNKDRELVIRIDSKTQTMVKSFHVHPSYRSCMSKNKQNIGKCVQFDLAILVVPELPSISFYKIGKFPLTRNDSVSMVGYGHGITRFEKELLKDKSFKATEERYKKEFGDYKKKFKNADYLITQWYYKKQAKRYQYLSDMYDYEYIVSRNNYIKRAGTNSIHEVQNLEYIIYSKLSMKKDTKEVTISSGDSGGPLLYRVGKTYQVNGVASYTGYEVNNGKKVHTANYVNLHSEIAQHFLLKFNAL